MLMHFDGCLVGRKVLWYTDNQNVAKNIVNGSKVPALNFKSVSIRELCVKKCLDLVPAWVPRADNQLADMYSKSTDCDDWFIHDNVFRELDEVWGKFNVDRFANSKNSKCSVFNSRWWCPGTCGIDCFRKVWSGQNNWLVPNPCLIPRVIDKMIDEKARGTLIVPYWPSAPFWSVLTPTGSKFACFV